MKKRFWVAASGLMFVGVVAGFGETLLERAFSVSTTRRVPMEGRQSAPAGAFGNEGGVVVWNDGMQNAIVAAKVDDEGQKSDEPLIQLNWERWGTANPAIAASGAGYLVGWEDTRSGTSTIYGLFLDEHRHLVRNQDFQVSPEGVEAFSPTIASTGADYLIVWTSRDDKAELSRIWATRYSAEGKGMTDEPFLIAESQEQISAPQLKALENEAYRLVWAEGEGEEGRRWMTVRVDVGVGPTVSSVIALNGTEGVDSAPAWAASNGKILLAWVRSEDGVPELHWGFLDDSRFSGSIGAFPIDYSPVAPITIGVTPQGGGFLVTWGHAAVTPEGQAFVYGIRISPDGAIMDTTARSVAGPFSGGIVDGAWVTGWQDEGSLLLTEIGHESGSQIFGTYIMENEAVGETSASARISEVLPSQHSPAVASNGEVTLVLWRESLPQGDRNRIYGARIAPDRTVLDPDGILISDAPGYKGRIAAVAIEGGFFIAWYDGRNPTQGSDIYGARLSLAGEVLDPEGIAIRAAGGGQSAPDIAVAGETCLIVWEDRLTQFSTDIHGVLVGIDGTIQSPLIRISEGEKSRTGPDVAVNGETFAVIWNKWGNPRSMYGATLNLDGTVRSTPNGTLIAEDDLRLYADIIPFEDDFLIAYSTFTANTEEGMAYRVGIRKARFDEEITTGPEQFVSAEVYNRAIIPELASNGSEAMAIWEPGAPSNPHLLEVHGTRIRPGDPMEIERLKIASGATSVMNSSVGPAPDGFLAAFWGKGPRFLGPRYIRAKWIGPPTESELSNRDLGSVGFSGGAWRADGALKISSAGVGTEVPNEESFHFVGRALTGNMEITARVVGIESKTDLAQMGLVLREQKDLGNRSVMVLAEPSGRLRFMRRDLEEMNSYEKNGVGRMPVWLKLTRIGGTVTAFQSEDGSRWRYLGTAPFDPRTEPEIGVIVASGHIEYEAVATIDNLSIRQEPGPVSVDEGQGRLFVSSLSLDDASGPGSLNEVVFLSADRQAVRLEQSIDLIHWETVGRGTPDPLGFLRFEAPAALFEGERGFFRVVRE